MRPTTLASSYRFAHNLIENPDVQSLTGFSAGSSIHNYDNNLQGSWFHTFDSRTQNELRVQFNYDSFNVIPNTPASVGLQIPGFANNLGTNIFLPNLTILRRWEFADNVTMVRGNHTIQFGVDEILRGNHTESHTFFAGPIRVRSFAWSGTEPLLPPSVLRTLAVSPLRGRRSIRCRQLRWRSRSSISRRLATRTIPRTRGRSRASTFRTRGSCSRTSPSISECAGRSIRSSTRSIRIREMWARAFPSRGIRSRITRP